MKRYFAHLEKDNAFNRILYVSAISKEDARCKIENKLTEQNRQVVLHKWLDSGKLVKEVK